MTRCVYCGRRIWPWQRMGWLIVSRHPRRRVEWHAKCRHRLVKPKSRPLR